MLQFVLYLRTTHNDLLRSQWLVTLKNDNYAGFGAAFFNTSALIQLPTEPSIVPLDLTSGSGPDPTQP